MSAGCRLLTPALSLLLGLPGPCAHPARQLANSLRTNASHPSVPMGLTRPRGGTAQCELQALGQNSGSKTCFVLLCRDLGFLVYENGTSSLVLRTGAKTNGLGQGEACGWVDEAAGPEGRVSLAGAGRKGLHRRFWTTGQTVCLQRSC